ncbi:unnamed protein product [Caenorhabditis brenneri]
MLNQIWANLKNTVKEQFRTKSMELHHAFQKEFPEIVVQTVDYDPYFGTELQRHKYLLDEKEVANNQIYGDLNDAVHRIRELATPTSTSSQ